MPPTFFALDLLPKSYQELDARQDADETGALHAPHIGLGEDRKAGFGDMAHPAPGIGPLDRRHVIVEADAEIRVVPAQHRLGHLPQREFDVALDLLEGQRLIGDVGIDAEAAGIGAAHAADDGNHLEGRRLAQGFGDKAPALFERRQIERLARGAQHLSHRPVGRMLAQHVFDQGAVGEAQDIIEEARRVFGVAARMRPAEHGDRALLPGQRTDRIGKRRVVREGRDEDDVGVALDHGIERLGPGVTFVVHAMAQLLAPGRGDLWHDAGLVRIHDPAEQALARPVADKIENRHTQRTHCWPKV